MTHELDMVSAVLDHVLVLPLLVALLIRSGIHTTLSATNVAGALLATTGRAKGNVPIAPHDGEVRLIPEIPIPHPRPGPTGMAVDTGRARRLLRLNR
jgi:hypothetical protein